MEKPAPELLEKIRQQFNYGPYPRHPVEKSPKNDLALLYIHHIGTPYYHRNQQAIETEGKVILDVGCGTGYKSLALAFANPGAKIVGIDLSERSIELARDRFQYQNCDSGEFHAIALDELPSLGLEFDYINCDELLYLFPQPAKALALMKTVLKPEGIIRSNLHSALGRANYFRAQTAFKLMGLMEENPEEIEIEIVRDFIKALKDGVNLKETTWNEAYDHYDRQKFVESVLMNHLFQGDKGYTVPELFAALQEAELEFIDMVHWRTWDLMELFNEPDNLPVFLSISLPESTPEQRLHLFELLHPAHRLLDFWCGHPNRSQPFTPIPDWSEADWPTAMVHLHPVLRTPRTSQIVAQCLREYRPLPLAQLLPIVGSELPPLDAIWTAVLIPPLLESPQPISGLSQRLQQIRPLNLETFAPLSSEEALASVTNVLSVWEAQGYVLLERV